MIFVKPKAHPTDRQPPRKTVYDARGRQAERLSEYFDFAATPEKRDRKVTREELLAILTRKWIVERETKWYRRLWRYFTAKSGAKPAPVGGGDDTDAT
jgi:hypothetical protein